MALRTIRESAGMTQNELATKLGVKHNTISQWETGLRSPRTDMLIKIASLFGVTIDELLKDSATDAEK